MMYLCVCLTKTATAWEVDTARGGATTNDYMLDVASQASVCVLRSAKADLKQSHPSSGQRQLQQLARLSIARNGDDGVIGVDKT